MFKGGKKMGKKILIAFIALALIVSIGFAGAGCKTTATTG
jgi:hypothetical protein